ncbi:MAG: monovalent cation/H+ antiporter subunit D [Rhodobacterales bacterium]|nr:monovalent cation/H+ antiporter subunit D [Rhodobacterales bacterium]MDX5390275.1 monovalent cation/H+ antiporter subunit D [Rhodobacterales bacterium]MDX5489963.1 monovalent cation/H+ antiporter subunit D [Rhodobacterales bacterium]
MNHWIIAPVLLPPLVAAVIILAARYQVALQRVFSVASTVGLLGISTGLLIESMSGRIGVYELGNWPAPFGIVLVLDRLSATMITLTSALAVAVVLYAIGSGWDKRGHHFHALFQFQLMGILGAFLTGDAFNLFVFFEVLLIASYGLMVHGGGGLRVKAGVQYVVTNLVGSSLFLIAVGLIYSVTGTLNMADLALKVPQVPAADQALLQTGAVLLLLVFGVKAALVPLHFWLPGTYANAPGPVAALFAIMTKVGAYSIIRLYVLAFGADAGEAAWIAAPWLLPAGLLTLVLGMSGVFAARSLGQMASFAVIGSMGMLLATVSVFTPQALSAALFYLVHSTFGAAALFLIADLVAERRGVQRDRLALAPRFAQGTLIAGLFFAAAIAVAGMPPLSGFLGKLLVLDAVRAHPQAVWFWTLILATSLLAILGFARGGSLMFWKSHALDAPATASRRPAPVLPFVAVGGLLAVLAVLTVAAGPVHAWLEQTSAQVFAPAGYIDAVLGAAEGGQ